MLPWVPPAVNSNFGFWQLCLQTGIGKRYHTPDRKQQERKFALTMPAPRRAQTGGLERKFALTNPLQTGNERKFALTQQATGQATERKFALTKSHKRRETDASRTSNTTPRRICRIRRRRRIWPNAPLKAHLANATTTQPDATEGGQKPTQSGLLGRCAAWSAKSAPGADLKHNRCARHRVAKKNATGYPMANGGFNEPA